MYIIYCRRILKYLVNIYVVFCFVLDFVSSFVVYIMWKSEYMMNKLIWKLKKGKYYICILWYWYLVCLFINIFVIFYVFVDVYS